MDAGIMPGWVRMNGRTLGGAGSGATELASASASAAFSYLWNTFPDTVASVVGGRGTSASSDFSAGKQIVIPTMQGLLQGGLDDMGSSPAGRFQTITDLTLSAGSTTATVFNSVRLAIGMTVIANGISAGTTITDINGTTITLSQPAAAGSTGTVSGARFSALGDAQMPGQIGGDTFTGLSNKNLPAVLPGGSVIVDYPAHTYITHETLATASINGSGIAFSWTPNQMQYGLGFVDDLSNPAARATLIRDATILDNSSARTFASLGGKQLFGIDTTQALEMSAALIMKSAQRICFDGPFNCMGANVVTGGGNVGVSFDGGIKPRTYNSVASLPTCNFDVLGLQAFLYAGDANAPTTGGTVSTGSTVVSRPIVCDSASWRYMN
ncbi:hypothetical protein [Methylobacterium sp. R2-1]|uniref:hypothetical protein n=1 Tax=Methylobacterium sp. R2-1 TaxID=2587064 RepID=UPI00161B34A1